MEIVKKQITIRELSKGYTDNDEEGVIGYGGKLDIRPPYQREFIYKEKQRNLVIDTVIKGFPLNIMYWNTKKDGSFEILDGQQRTISICEYIHNNFSFEKKIFERQADDIQARILDYKLDIYQCKGDASERLAWFEIINVAGEVLKRQELLNATYAGTWTSEAKKKFSKTGCPAYQIGRDFMSGSPIRQDYLETVIKWINKGDVAEYMNQHAGDSNANELWLYFESVIAWVKTIFVSNKADIRKEMKNVEWGELYNKYKNKKLDSKKIQAKVAKLMQDDEITKPSGIYYYILDGNEKYLSIRAFKNSDKTRAYERQKGICANKKKCPRKGERLALEEMEADHIKPWSKGGKSEASNCQMLCLECNRRKGSM